MVLEARGNGQLPQRPHDVCALPYMHNARVSRADVDTG